VVRSTGQVALMRLGLDERPAGARVRVAAFVVRVRRRRTRQPNLSS
jgi:hypothetical protein